MMWELIILRTIVILFGVVGLLGAFTGITAMFFYLKDKLIGYSCPTCKKKITRVNSSFCWCCGSIIYIDTIKGKIYLFEN